MLTGIKKIVDKLLGVRVLYEGRSPCGSLKVYEEQGTVNLVSGDKFVQSSYRKGKKPLGSVWDYFLVAPLFAPEVRRVKNVCLLGLGAGVAVKLLNRVYKMERIVGVEIDEEVVKLGKKFFDLNDKNLEVITKDAAAYVKETSEKFDLIIVDTFHGETVAPQCATLEFFEGITKRLKDKEGLVLVDRVAHQDQEAANYELVNILHGFFPQVYSLKVRKNIFYFGLKKPLTPGVIVERIRNAGVQNGFLAFLEKFKEGDLHPL